MSRKIVCGCLGTIYDAQMSKKPGIMTENRRECTDECIAAVAEHMRDKANYNDSQKGFWEYRWPGLGKLTWESEPATAKEDEK